MFIPKNMIWHGVMDVMGSSPSTSITSPPEWSRMSFIKWGWFSWFATNVTIFYMLATHKNAKHVNYKMFDYSILLYYILYIIYYILYIICTCNVSHMFFKQIWMNLTHDTFCDIYSDIYPHISKHIFWHLFQHIFWKRGGVFDPKLRVLESKDPHLTCRA
jgi:hypothetical protein